MTSCDIDRLRTNLYELYARLRPDAVAIVDSFEFTDQYLKSAIGTYDGQAYENLYKFAVSSSLNKTQASYLRMLSRKKLKCYFLCLSPLIWVWH